MHTPGSRMMIDHVETRGLTGVHYGGGPLRLPEYEKRNQKGNIRKKKKRKCQGRKKRNQWKEKGEQKKKDDARA